jgi:hypothetical protein
LHTPFLISRQVESGQEIHSPDVNREHLPLIEWHKGIGSESKRTHFAGGWAEGAKSKQLSIGQEKHPAKSVKHSPLSLLQ